MKSKFSISCLGGLGKKERGRLATLLRFKKSTISISDAAKALSIDAIKAAKLLSYYTKKGWLNRIGAGIYLPVPLEASDANGILEDPLVIADQLFAPCYIGGWSAAEYWGMTEQIFNSIIVVTQKDLKKRRYKISSIEYLLRSVNPSLFFGLKTVWINNNQVKISDHSKTIIDILMDPKLGGGIRVCIELLRYFFTIKDLDIKILISYLEKINIGAIYKRLGFLLESYFPDQQALIKCCSLNLTKGYSKLDPLLKNNNKLISRWKLWVPEYLKQELKKNYDK